jgi:hypothetical protein
MRNFLPSTQQVLRNTMAMLLLALMGTAAFAQSTEPITNANLNNPFVEATPNLVSSSNTTATPEALWDIQQWFNATDSTNGDLGMAGCIYAFGEWWVSRWASDTLYRFTQSGQLISEFTIPGLTGTRCFTTDGTFLYAGTAGPQIYQINPTTQTLGTTINTSVTTGVRHCTYDPTLDNNNGGFWVGNFNTDIVPVSMSGATLAGTIPAATHGLGGMYGSAYDGASAGGPYLWIFHQGGANNCEITRLQLPGGTQTLVTNDVLSDVGVASGLSSALAGGLFITNSLVPGQRTIGGLAQGTPSNIAFAYELSDPVIPAADAEVDNMRPTRGYTQIPLGQVFAETFDLELSNVGSDPLDTVFVSYDVVYNGATNVFTDVQSTFNLASGNTVIISSLPFTPANGVGSYEVTATASVGANQNDTVTSNNVATFTFDVTDSTFARDDNVPDGGNGYAVSTADWAYAMANFTLNAADTVTSIFISLAVPTDLDTTYGLVATTVAGTPNAILTQTPVQIISSGQNDYVLAIPGGLALPPGEYSFGCYEGVGTTINLNQSNNIFTQGTNYFFTGGGGWSGSNIPTARFIRPNFGSPTAVSVDEMRKYQVNVFPNPNNGTFAVSFREELNTELTVRVLNPVGQEVARKVVNPSAQRKVDFDLNTHAAGVYFVQVEGIEGTIVKKIMLTK